MRGESLRWASPRCILGFFPPAVSWPEMRCLIPLARGPLVHAVPCPVRLCLLALFG